MKKIILALMILLIITGIYYFESQKVVIPSTAEKQIEKPAAQNDSTLETKKSSIQKILTKSFKGNTYTLSPELTGIVGYLNTENNTKIKDFRGKVVLIDFWTYSCINCIRTFPYLKSWHQKYKDQGLVIIGVHTPEFGFEEKFENVKMAMEKYGINYRVVQDNNYATWKVFKNRFWPRKYLIDAEGYIRFNHIGEGAYVETEKKIQELLAEIKGNVTNIDLTKPLAQKKFLMITPELYAGYEFMLPRGQEIGNLGGLVSQKKHQYILPKKIDADTIYLSGQWLSNYDNLAAKGKGAIVLKYMANSVNIVADNLSSQIQMEVYLNGDYISPQMAGEDVRFNKSRAFVQINEPRLYNIVKGGYGRNELKLTTKGGFSFNAFTFG
ncbi:thiol-disulfide isomerase [archaeon]|nr:thiol-disulfide isomerase [archaeon]